MRRHETEGVERGGRGNLFEREREDILFWGGERKEWYKFKRVERNVDSVVCGVGVGDGGGSDGRSSGVCSAVAGGN